MTQFKIKEGEVWAGNFWKRHRTRVSGLTTGQFFRWNLKLDMTRCEPGTTIKLCGISTASPFRWKRVKRGGWEQAGSLTHEDSERVIATKKSAGSIALKTYTYKNGYGPATEMSSRFSASEHLGEVGEANRFTIFIDERPGEVKYTLKDATNERSHVTVPRERGLGKLKHRTFAHAKGYKQPNAPADILIEADV
jgi:hypothetical protein